MLTVSKEELSRIARRGDKVANARVPLPSSQTLTSPELQWGESTAKSGVELLHLVIAWSRDEPHRHGEAAPVEGRSILGRGDRAEDDFAPRLTFLQQRPLGSTRQPPLSGPRLSRVQLELSPTDDGKLAVTRVGRCPLLINGVGATAGVVGPGDVLTLQNALILFVVRRRAGLCELRTPLAAQPFEFGRPDAHGIVGESASAWLMRDVLAFVAQSSGHVLVRGDSGVGKELAARAIHQLSARRARPFVARNAATFPEGLIDAELFGTAKGYPNAGSPERTGLIAEAEGGTLFLDEIGELPQQLQAHLLRVLDRDGEYQRLGEPRPRRANLRIVAATNRPLESLKHDFLARFALRVELPDLSPRREDIPLLLAHLLDGAAASSPSIGDRFFERRAGALAEPRIAPQLIEALLRHPFTHHLRELERLMWISLSTSPDSYVDLTPQVSAELRASTSAAPGPAPEPDAAARVLELKRPEIEAALTKARGSVTTAARLLGLKNRFVLYRLLKRHGIALPDTQSSGG